MSVPYDELFLDADLNNGLPLGMTRAIADAETGYLGDWARRNRAVSPAGAVGPMQLMPATGARFGLKDRQALMDPARAIPAAGQYLGALQREFQDPALTAAAYNAGEVAVRKHGGIPPYKETRGYVPRVLKNLSASAAQVQAMQEKYSPGMAQRALDFFLTPAYGADQPPAIDLSGLYAIVDEEVPHDGQIDLSGLYAIADEPPTSTALSPDVQTGLRATIKGLAAPLVMAADAVNAVPNLVAKGINAVRPGTVGYLPPAGDYVDAGLRAMGVNPEAQSLTERALTAGLGAASSMGLGAAAGIPSAVTGPAGAVPQVLGAASSSAASDIAAEAGLPVPAQVAVGIGAGMVPAAASKALQDTARGLARAGQIGTLAGKEAIAGRVMAKQASAPVRSAARVGDPELMRRNVPGSVPTLAEVTQDEGLARLQKVTDSAEPFLRAGADRVNRERLANMDNAIHAALDKANRVPRYGQRDVLDRITDLKRQVGSTFEAMLANRGIDPLRHPVAPDKTMAKLDELALRHEGHEGLSALVEKIRGNVGEPTFNRLWNARQSLDDAIYERWATSTADSRRDLKRVGEQVRRAMNADLIDAVPEFEPFLRRYAKLARSEARIKLGRELAAKVENAGRNAADDDGPYGSRVVSGAKLENLNLKAAERKGNAKLSKGQRRAFDAALEEKRRANILTAGGAPHNSATAQNLAINQIISNDILSGIFGDQHPTGVKGAIMDYGRALVGAPMTLLTRGVQDDIVRMITAGLIDPEEGARLLRLGLGSVNAPAAGPQWPKTVGAGVLSELYGQAAR